VSGEQCAAEGTMTGLCTEPAAGRFTGACVHEHVKTRWLCQWHAGPVAQLTAICRDCWEGPQRHECPVVLAPAQAVTS
jgi:hypothetical protein